MASRRVRFHPAADAELEAAAAWYDGKRPGLGLTLVRTVRAAANSLAEAPHRWPSFQGNRRALLHRFPYALVYREISEDDIEIVAVAHLKRRPGFWRSR